jgi:hypothetical protein
MKNPARSLKRTLQRVRNGAAVVARRLRSVVAVVREALNCIRERHLTLLTEIAALVLQQLIVVVIERTIAWLVRKATMGPTPARVVPFPTLRPAT